MITCKYCKKILSKSTNLKRHQETKTCLKIRNEISLPLLRELDKFQETDNFLDIPLTSEQEKYYIHYSILQIKFDKMEMCPEKVLLSMFTLFPPRSTKELEAILIYDSKISNTFFEDIPYTLDRKINYLILDEQGLPSVFVFNILDTGIKYEVIDSVLYSHFSEFDQQIFGIGQKLKHLLKFHLKTHKLKHNDALFGEDFIKDVWKACKMCIGIPSVSTFDSACFCDFHL